MRIRCLEYMKPFAAKIGYNLGALESLARSLKIQLERQPGEPDSSFQLRLNDAIRHWQKPKAPPPERPRPAVQEQPPPPLPKNPDEVHKAAVERIVAGFPSADEDAKNTLRLVATSLVYGTSADKLAKVLELNRDKFVRPRAKRLRDSGLWVDGQLAVNIVNGSEAEVHLAVLLAALVAEDLIELPTESEPE